MSTWPQRVYASFIFIVFVHSLYNDGKQQSGGGLIATLIVFPAQTAILYFGGFWTPWGFAP